MIGLGSDKKKLANHSLHLLMDLKAGAAAACIIVIVGLADGGWGMLISRGGEDKGLGSS